MLRCQYCRVEMRATAQFCNRCGRPLRSRRQGGQLASLSAGATERDSRVTRAAVPQPTRCAQCDSLVAPSARFCGRCGLRAGAPAPVAPPSEPPEQLIADEIADAKPRQPAPTKSAEPPPVVMAEQTVHCEYCGNAMPSDATTCPACGERVSEQASRPDVRLAPDSGTVAGAVDTRGSWAAVAGAAVVLVGCFLPLVQGDATAVLPGLARVTSYALLVPLSAVAIALLGWIATVGRFQSRALSGAGVIALGSPWTVTCLLAIAGAMRLFDFLGPFSGGANIGVGLVALAIGFVVALVGGFIIVNENARAE